MTRALRGNDADMPQLRRIAALALTAAAFGAAACGEDEEAPEREGQQSPAPVNTDTPAQNETTTPAPEDSGNPTTGEEGAPEEDAGRGDGSE